MKRTFWLALLLTGAMLMPYLIMAVEPPAPAQLDTITLEKALELAYRNSQTLQAASKNVEIAREGVRQAEAAYGPTLDYQFAYNRLDEGQIINYIPLIQGPDEIYGGELTLTQPLYTFGRLGAVLKLAQCELARNQEEERKTKQELTYNVVDAYYRLWVAEQGRQVAQNSYNNIGRHYQQVKHFYEAGTASKYDLLKAQVQWDNLKPQVIKAENSVALAKLSLATLIGYNKEAVFTVVYDSSELNPKTGDRQLNLLLEESYKNRPEMREIKIAAQAAEVKTQKEAAEYAPTLALVGTYEGTGTELNPGDWNKSWTLTLALTGNLYNNGATRSKVNAAKKSQELVAIQDSGLKDNIRLQVEQALLNLKESAETIQANQASMELAKESLRLTQARYDAGMATTMDIMDAQLALDQALNGYYQGIYTYLIANANLNLVTGRDI